MIGIHVLFPAFCLFCFLSYITLKNVIRYCKKQRDVLASLGDDNKDEHEQLHVPVIWQQFELEYFKVQSVNDDQIKCLKFSRMWAVHQGV